MISMAIDDDMGNGTNWLLWGGLALVIVLIILALPLINLGPGGLFEEPGAQPGGEAEQAQEEQLNDTNTTAGNQSGEEGVGLGPEGQFEEPGAEPNPEQGEGPGGQAGA